MRRLNALLRAEDAAIDEWVNSLNYDDLDYFYDLLVDGYTDDILDMFYDDYYGRGYVYGDMMYQEDMMGLSNAKLTSAGLYHLCSMRTSMVWKTE